MTVTEIRAILEAPYNRAVWKDFLKTQFTNNQLNAEDRPIKLSDEKLSKQCLSLGSYEVSDYVKIGIFEVTLQEKVAISRNRVALRNLLKDLTQQVAGAMVVFVQGDKWRFSYISKRKVKNTTTDEIEEKQTAPKRYTYLFGKGEKALTAAQRFDKLIQQQRGNLYHQLSLDDFEEAFSVEKLSKEFFKNYKELYEDFVQYLTGKRYTKKGSKYVEQIVGEPDWQLTALFRKDEKAARDFCKRMMGRIVFLYFIQKKGWLAVPKGKAFGEGAPDYLYDLFRKSKHQDDFYASELSPLFFKTLNNEDSQNPAREKRFPYLNGGLFDDSHDRDYKDLHLPEVIFRRLFETFNNYNFTIYEDAPDEHTVAVDPEMLGHIFENLLEDNKDKGAFYTPKEIVHYMCRESLKAYLYAQEDLPLFGNEEGRSAIAKIISQQELEKSEKDFAEKHAYDIMAALERVKICDPAIGSGAFPMGVLQEIFNAQIYLQELKGFRKYATDASIKKHIIEESIYGVDIDAGAVDIARLRFWLSLVVDETEPQPLPNLAFKIVCANTLIPLGELKGLDMNAKASEAVRKLAQIRHDYFEASSETKKQVERDFRKVQTDLLSLRELATKDNYEFYTKLYEFDPFKDQSCSWFDPWWMFGIKDGFDIVIGNPPYVGISKIPYKKDLQKYGFETFESTGDMYAIFYEKGIKLLKKSGILCFITSSQWMKAGYGASLRSFFTAHNPLRLILLGPGVFKSATVDTNILVVANSAYKTELIGATVTEADQLNDLNSLPFQTMPYVGEEIWEIANGEKQKIYEHIKKVAKPLDKWDVEIYRGILTGYNKAFIIGGKERAELIDADSKNEEIIRPILKGREIEKYVSKWEKDYIIFVPWHFPLQEDKGIVGASTKAESEFLRRYNYLYNYLKEHKIGLSNRNKEETGIRYEWYALQRCAATYKSEFSKEKVIWKRIGSKLRFSYSDEEIYCLDSTCIATGEKIKYLTALLNSKVCNYLLFEKAPKTGMGDLIISVQALEPLLVYYPNEKQQFWVEAITNFLIHLKKEENSILSHTPNDRLAAHLEDILNMMVYELYFEVHMKDVGIDVLQFIAPQLEALRKKPIEVQIEAFYLWYQTPENPVRQRMQLIETRSPDIIAVIQKSLQQ